MARIIGRKNPKENDTKAKKSPQKPSNDGDGTNAESDKERPRASRELTRSDWLTLRYMICVEGVSPSAAAQTLRIHPTTLRLRIRTENWRDPKRVAELPALEELIIMRNQKEILDALSNMSGKLKAAMQSKDPTEVELAMKKAELVGKTMRSNQSAARAVEVSATTSRKVKANAKQPESAALDRAAIKAELDRLAAKAPA